MHKKIEIIDDSKLLLDPKKFDKVVDLPAELKRLRKKVSENRKNRTRKKI